MIAGALVSDNFTSVGKKELENDPIVGTMGKIMDAAFIDRDDPKKAVEGLKKVEELARKGLSILIAPEGTRLDTTEVGPFKKGPFRIAMSAGIPIVPIVIRNAEVIAARDSSTFNPGTVDVVVYPPIPIDDWTHDNLTDRIAEVRQLYLDTLMDWPHDELPTPGLYTRKKAPVKPVAKRAPAKAAVKKAAEKKTGEESDRKSGRQKGYEKGCRERPAVKVPADQFAPFTATDDALVLASVASPAEEELLNDWLERQRREHPESKVDVLRLPVDDDPPQGCWRGSSRNWRPTRTGRSFRCACSGCPAACRRARRWLRYFPAGTPTGLRSCCKSGSCARTRRVPGWSPVSPLKYRSFVSSGATPLSPRTPGSSRDS